MNITSKTKTTRGRQKIEIKKIENMGSRQVTFTKRRGGLFKKAAELCILTNADVAVIVKSPGGRIFAFGHPGVGPVMERYLGCGGGLPESAVTEDVARGFSRRYDDVAKELAAEKRRREMIERSGNVINDRFWWEEPMEGIGLEELESYVAALEELRNKVSTTADEMMMLMRSSKSSINPMTSENNNNGDSGELLYNHFINQSHDNNTNSLVPLGYDFCHAHPNLEL